MITKRSHDFWVVLVVLTGTLAILFWRVFTPGYTLFSNDGPLGSLIQESRRLPAIFSGEWMDLNSIGYRSGGAVPSISYGLLQLTGPVGFAKLDAIVALLVLGLGAWCFFRQLRLAHPACLLGSLAATLNVGFFSAACWGVATHAITVGMTFFALAALLDTSSPRRWLRVALAGLAVGMGVTEGADIGAIFSIYVAVFVIYQAWMSDGPPLRKLVSGCGRVTLVAIFAAFMAAQTISVLVATQIQGVVGTRQDSETKEQRWDFATQWSLPKTETLSLFVPGLFGYRMDTPQGLPDYLQSAYQGGEYWGRVGRDPAWDRYFAAGRQGQPPGGFLRYAGGANYFGVLVFLIAAWAGAQALRKKESAFCDRDKRFLWFWLIVTGVSLLLAFGRFAPFYWFLYQLPYFSTIRNPAKFLHLVDLAVVILFAYGMDGIWKWYVCPAVPGAKGRNAFASGVPSRSVSFEKGWTRVIWAVVSISALVWLIYASSRPNLVRYLQQVGFQGGLADAIAGFSIQQGGIFLIFLLIGAVLMTLLMRGTFIGPRSRWCAWLLAAFLVLDLGRANLPFILFVDYPKVYATNPIIDRLRQKPYEQRVAVVPEWLNRAVRLPSNLDIVSQLYRIEWAQHLFLYYNIQSLDIIQMPRMPEDLVSFERTFQPTTMADLPGLITRRWQLTNTRYLIGAAAMLDVFNAQIDPEKRRFRYAERFQIMGKPGVANPTRLDELTATPATNGDCAVIEFTGALPRAKLYSNWQVMTNDQAALTTLASAQFDPEKSVLVAKQAQMPAAAAGGTNQNAGDVDFVKYAPKRVVLKANASAKSILLLNDHYDPNWKVSVDGNAATLLRCNYIMRGVELPPGQHQVEFSFEPPIRGLYVTLAAVALAVVLSGILLVRREPKRVEQPAQS